MRLFLLHERLYQPPARENNLVRQVDARAEHSIARVSAVLPDSAAEALSSQLKKDPGLLELFYLRAFPDLDASEDRLGMLRLPADGLYIVEGSKAHEAGSVSSRFDRDGVKRFFSGLTRLPYDRSG